MKRPLFQQKVKSSFLEILLFPKELFVPAAYAVNFYRLLTRLIAVIFFLSVTLVTEAQELLLGLTSVEGPQGGGTAFTLNSSDTNFTVRKGFYQLGTTPYGDLIKGKDGNFYGMTDEGGIYRGGTIFKITPAGKVTILRHLSQPDGLSPRGSLTLASDGSYYGMTYIGGDSGNGTIFKITPDGSFQVLKSFDFTNDGGSPNGNLTQGRDGNFYGMTLLGGKNNNGTIFRITPAGAFTVLRSFNGTTNGGSPYGSLIQGRDGNFYGMTSKGGTHGSGTIFKVSSTGTFTVLRALNGTSDGGIPNGSLIQSTDGNFYGMTYGGGENFVGTIFKITPKGAFTVLHDLRPEEGSHTYGSLVRGSDNNFYGMTYSGGNNGYGTIFKFSPGGVFSVLKHLEYSTTGGYPSGSLVQGNDGHFYGLTSSYGPSGYGTIFKINSTGTFSLLVSLPDNNEGNGPAGNLVQARDGFYYGTTTYGGEHGNGTIFRMCTNGTFTTLHSFDRFTDGSTPESGLMQAADGNFYGTTTLGGPNGYGTIYKITPRGTFTVLHSFDFNTNGRYPAGGLVQGNDGDFYGITFQGGKIGGGVIYKISPTGTLTTLRDLSYEDGVDSKATLVTGKDGNFYGITHQGGTSFNGTIFKITPNGTFRVLYNFNQASGGFSRGSLIQGTDGNFYGMTRLGGGNGRGAIFKLTSSSAFTVLYNFNENTDGYTPLGSLTRDKNGNLYGMNSEGGAYQGGTIFRLTPGGTFTVLRHLIKSTDGGTPLGSLILQKAKPVAKAQNVVTAVNTPKAITLSGTGGSPLVYTIVTPPKNGTLTGSGARRVYTPKTGFSGTDSFTFTVTWGCQTSPAKTITITVVNTPGTVRLNSGGGAVTTSLGSFQADSYLTGSTNISSTTAAIEGTSDDVLYQIARKAEVSGGSFGYSIPVTNGNYTVKLHFAEIAFSASGKRTFSVTVEDAPWLTNYDIFTAAGGSRKAVIATRSVSVRDGTLHLNFISRVDKACVSAIEVIPASSTIPLANRELEAEIPVAVNLYPNPVKNKITLSLQVPDRQVTTSITDVKGVIVSAPTQQTPVNNRFEIDLEHLKAGVYLLHLHTSQGRQSFKFIKE